jgi:hypothetical protein
MGRHAIHLGAAWELPDCAGPAADGGGRRPWRRWFHRPTGLAAGDRLLLVWEPGAGQTEDCEPGNDGHGDGRPQRVWLTVNGTDLPPLPAAAPPADVWERDVTHLVRERNELLLHGVTESDTDRGAGPRTSLPRGWGRLSLVVVSD